MKKMLRNEKGQSALEYAIILAAVVGLIITFFVSQGGPLNQAYNAAASKITSAAQSVQNIQT